MCYRAHRLDGMLIVFASSPVPSKQNQKHSSRNGSNCYPQLSLNTPHSQSEPLLNTPTIPINQAWTTPPLTLRLASRLEVKLVRLKKALVLIVSQKLCWECLCPLKTPQTTISWRLSPHTHSHTG